MCLVAAVRRARACGRAIGTARNPAKKKLLGDYGSDYWKGGLKAHGGSTRPLIGAEVYVGALMRRLLFTLQVGSDLCHTRGSGCVVRCCLARQIAAPRLRQTDPEPTTSRRASLPAEARVTTAGERSEDGAAAAAVFLEQARVADADAGDDERGEAAPGAVAAAAASSGVRGGARDDVGGGGAGDRGGRAAASLAAGDACARRAAAVPAAGARPMTSAPSGVWPSAAEGAA